MKSGLSFPTYLSYGQIGDTIKDPIFMVVTSSNVSDVQIPAYITSQRYLVRNDLVQNAIEKAGLEKDIMRIEDVYEAYKKDLWRNFLAITVQIIGCIFMEIMIDIIYKKILHKEIKHLIISWLLTGSVVVMIHWVLSLSLMKAFVLLIIVEFFALCRPWKTILSR